MEETDSEIHPEIDDLDGMVDLSEMIINNGLFFLLRFLTLVENIGSIFDKSALPAGDHGRMDPEPGRYHLYEEKDLHVLL